MKRIICFIILAYIGDNLNAQTILNNSFESHSDSSVSTPKYWSYSPSAIASARCVNTFSHSGKSSLELSVSDTNNFIFVCNQYCELNVPSPKRIHIVAWLKTKDCSKGAGLFCTQLNINDKKIDYTSSRQQEALVKNTRGWTKTELIVLLRPDVKKIEVALLLYGAGSVWFDDVSIENFSANEKKTTPEVAAYLDTLIKDVRENSLWKDSIDWKVFCSQLKSLADGMQTYHEAQLLANYMIGELKHHGDNHSTFMVPFAVKEMNSSDIMGEGRKFKAEYNGQGIGYVSMPGFATLNDSLGSAFASNAQQMIKNIDRNNKICGWIVDLRDDPGGTCVPMIEALGPILGEGVYNFDVSLKGDTSIALYKNGEVYVIEMGKKELVWCKVMNPYKLINENVPVAVLIGSGCGSSGECTAASFIGRHDTKLFGQPTAGFTKGNEGFILPDSSMIIISSGIQTDRNGKKYPERIFPDVQVGESANDKTDAVRDKATEWLVSFGQCK